MGMGTSNRNYWLLIRQLYQNIDVMVNILVMQKIREINDFKKVIFVHNTVMYTINMY